MNLKNKLRITWCSEFSVLNTGFAVYSREILKRLYNTNKYDILEMASYSSPSDSRGTFMPWKLFHVLPHKDDEKGWEIYNSSTDNQFGTHKFEEACLAHHPHVICGIRDTWQDAHILRSPFRPYYYFIWMPTVDACFIKGTHIITNNGVKNIEDITVKDKVLTHDGTYQQVIQTFINQNNKQILQIKAQKFALPISLTEDHPVFVIKRQKQKWAHTSRKHRSINHKSQDGQYISAKEINKGDYLIIPPIKESKKIDILDLKQFLTYKHYYKIANNCIIQRSTSHKIPEKINIDEDILMLLGLYVAEGSVNKAGTTVSFSMNGETEQDHLSFIEKILQLKFNIVSYRIKGDDKGEEICFGSVILNNIFTNLFGQDAHTKYIPQFIMNAPSEQIIPFLKGLFIGDGCNTHSPHKKKVIEYSTVSKELAIQIFHLLLKIGILATLYEFNNKNRKRYDIVLFNIYAERFDELTQFKPNHYTIGNLKNDKSWIEKETGNAIICVHDTKIVNQQHNIVYNLKIDKNNNYVTSFLVHNCGQQEEWISMYSEADTVLTYQDWSYNYLKENYGTYINLVGTAPPCASSTFQPLPNREELKSQTGLGGKKIIGTVMRNQRRKLYPHLFKAFREFLNRTGRNDTYLYCHTSYPDAGWDIPKLILQNNLSSKILLTYVCNNCKKAFPTFFNDAVMHCPQCHHPDAHISNVQIGVPEEILCYIYNIMDLYIQFSNCEGFAIPLVEAAACGTPVAGTDYSGMEDVIRKLNGTPIKILTLEPEVETGRLLAIPDNEHLIKILSEFALTPKSQLEYNRKEVRKTYEKHYNWDTTAEVWMKQIDKVDFAQRNSLWSFPPRIRYPATEVPPNLDNVQFARWLISEVLCEPERIGSYMEARLIRDLNYSFSTMVVGGLYYQELSMISSKPNLQPFNREIAFQHFTNLCNRRNYWENKRCQKN